MLFHIIYIHSGKLFEVTHFKTSVEKLNFLYLESLLARYTYVQIKIYPNTAQY